MYPRTTPHSMQNSDLCEQPAPPHVIRIHFSNDQGAWFYELAKQPPCGLSSVRFNEILSDVTYALDSRKATNDQTYQSFEERQVHAAWYSAHANALQTEARLAGVLAKRLGMSSEVSSAHAS